jgi:hypothetical protein
MKIVGCDFHPSYQQVAIFNTETAEVEENKLMHASGRQKSFTGNWRRQPWLVWKPRVIPAGLS